MTSVTENDVLNRLLVIHNRSLPTYLRYAVPWWNSHRREASELMAQIASDQEQLVDQLADLIISNKGSVEKGEFPLSFSALHDLSFEYLLGQMLPYQVRTVAAIQRCVDLLPERSRGQAVAQASLGMAQAHLDSLQEMADKLAGAAA